MKDPHVNVHMPLYLFIYLLLIICLCIVVLAVVCLCIEVMTLTAMINQTRQSTRDCLGLASRGSKKVNRNSAYSCNYINTKEEDDATSEKMLKEIEANQDSALSFCTEKVLLVQQAYDLVSFFFPFSFSSFAFF